MKALADKEPVQPQNRPVMAPDVLQHRLAEAASYAVLRRIAPALRHDVAGLMQPVGMLTKILQRRVQNPQPDLTEITKNLESVSALVKEATAGCMNAMGWMILCEDRPVNLQTGVTEAIKLLGPALFGTDLELRNELADEPAVAPQSYLRSVVTGALLAFCDQRSAGNILQVTLEAGAENSDAHCALLMCMLPGDTVKPPEPTDTDHRSRPIDWQDVQAMADSFNVTMERGDGWLRLGLPQAIKVTVTDARSKPTGL